MSTIRATNLRGWANAATGGWNTTANYTFTITGTVTSTAGWTVTPIQQEPPPRVLSQDYGIIRQEIHCHECNQYVQFSLDMNLDGNHVLYCPNCGHEHCRVVQGGRITGDRWAQRNGATYRASNVRARRGGYAAAQLPDGTIPRDNTLLPFMMDSWMNVAAHQQQV